MGFQEWWDGNSTKAWRRLVALVLTGILAFVGWMGLEIYNLHAECVCKAEYREDRAQDRRSLERIENKIDEVNRWLRNWGED